MYERKIPVDLDCPLRLTMSLIGTKWKSCIIDSLLAWGEEHGEVFEKNYSKE